MILRDVITTIIILSALFGVFKYKDKQEEAEIKDYKCWVYNICDDEEKEEEDE